MSLNCACPETILEPIIIQSCQLNIGQIQKLYFQKQGYEWVSPTVDITAKADWELLQAAVDDTKVIVSPLIAADPIIESGGVMTKGGGDNSTLDGQEIITAVNPAKFSAKFESLSADEVASLRKLMCKGKLGVYLVTGDGQIIARKVSATNHAPLAITSYAVASKKNEGFGSNDSNEIFFNLQEDYDETIDFINPADFDPLIDLDITI